MAIHSNPYVDSLLWGGLYWEDPTVTYYFRGSWTDAEKAAYRTSLQSVSDVADISFQEVFTEGAANLVETVVSGYAWLGLHATPEFATGTYFFGNLQISAPGQAWGYYNRDAWASDTARLSVGGYSHRTFAHEILHGLGLAHPHDTGGGSSIMPGVTAAFGSYGTANMNQGINTIMSYNRGWTIPQNPPANGIYHYGYNAGPMALDIAALQYLYGANTSHRTGNDTYVLPGANTAGTYWTAIWDAGGDDTIVYNGNGNTSFDLRAATLTASDATGGGGRSYVNGIYGGFTIAAGVTIENVSGGSGRDVITGNAANNTLSGNADNDTIRAAGGNDVLIGGSGSDYLDGESGSDTASYAGSSAGVTVNLATGAASGGDATGDTLLNIENLIGSQLNDSLTGDGGNNVLTGAGGNDTLAGGGGDDTLDGGAGIDTVSYAGSASGVTVDLSSNATSGGDATGDVISGFENVTGSDHADILTGDAGANVLSGGAGDDTLAGGVGGVDTSNGGAGRDTVSYALSASAVIVDLSNNSAAGFDAAGDNFNSIENVTGSAFNDYLIGDGEANVLRGRAGIDFLMGNGGADSLDGGAGTDWVSYQTSVGGVTVDLGTGIGSGGDAEGDTLTNIENLIGSAQADILTGGSVDNVIRGGGGGDTLRGGAGDDTLVGGAGADMHDGGAGIDTASYATSASYVVVDLSNNSAAGADAVGDNFNSVENVTGTAFNDYLIGDSNANVLRGLAGVDFLMGNGGADTLDGGAGTDWVSYQASAGGVTVDLGAGTGAGGDAEGDSITNIENLTGSAQADALIGNAGENVIRGGEGDDVLVGGAGADFLNGGAGTDTVSYAGAAVFVAVDLLSNHAEWGDAHGDGFNSIENVTGTAYADFLFGDDAANILRGGAGDDWLRGEGGADTLEGGAGVDWASYVTSSSGVTVDLGAGTGLGGDAEGDTLIGIERVIGSGFGDTLAGDAGANILRGGGGNDRLEGAAGKDLLLGGVGDDIFIGGIGADMHDGGAGSDTISYAASTGFVMVDLLNNSGAGIDAAGDNYMSIENVTGSAYRDFLMGDGAANGLNGGGGGDYLAGGGGADMLTGGGGSDRFVFAAGSGTDTIQDFAAGAGSDDVLDISAYGYQTLAEILAVTTDDGAGNTTIQLDAGNAVHLMGVTVSALHGDDFLGLVSAMASFGSGPVEGPSTVVEDPDPADKVLIDPAA